jgi:hypothetical protein
MEAPRRVVVVANGIGPRGAYVRAKSEQDEQRNRKTKALRRNRISTLEGGEGIGGTARARDVHFDAELLLTLSGIITSQERGKWREL